MTLPRVRYDDRNTSLIVGAGPDEVEIDNTGADEFHAHIADIGPASATSLRDALRRAHEMTLLISDGPYEQFDPEYSLAGPVSLEEADGALAINVMFEIDDWYDQHQVVQHVKRLLGPLLERTRCEFGAADMHPQFAAAPWFAWVALLPTTRGRTVQELYEVALDAEALLSAAATGELTRATTLDLLRAGHTAALLGQSESQWLDVKRQDYDLSRGSDKGKISLAQDVARFANAEEGGLLVVGFATSKDAKGETITKLTPVRALPNGTTRHSKAIDNRVFPPVDGLTVDEIPVNGGVLVVVNVPPQPEESKPFLVHGAIVNGNVEGAFISIVRRRGEDSIPITAQSIHSTLAAGRALLRRGIVTDPPDLD